jgi:hypothetical protein
MFRPIYRSSSGIHIRVSTVNQVILYIKINCLNKDAYCATGVNVLFHLLKLFHDTGNALICVTFLSLCM